MLQFKKNKTLEGSVLEMVNKESFSYPVIETLHNRKQHGDQWRSGEDRGESPNEKCTARSKLILAQQN